MRENDAERSRTFHARLEAVAEVYKFEAVVINVQYFHSA